MLDPGRQRDRRPDDFNSQASSTFVREDACQSSNLRR